MAKALEQEPQVQIFGRDNVKNNPQRLWPIYVFPSIQPPPKEKKQIKQLLLVRRATTAKFLT